MSKGYRVGRRPRGPQRHLDSGYVEDGILLLDQAQARQLVLVRAIEEADPQGKLLSEAEREQLEREALESSRRSAAGAIDYGQYLLERARLMLAAVENRNARVAALQHPEPWQRWLLLALPL